MSKVVSYLKSVAKSGKVWLGTLAGLLSVLAALNLPAPYAGYVTTALLVLGALGIHAAQRKIGTTDQPVE